MNWHLNHLKQGATSLRRTALRCALLSLGCAAQTTLWAHSPVAVNAQALTNTNSAALTLTLALQLALKNIETQIAQSLVDGAQADLTAADRAPLPVLSTSLGSMDLQNGLGHGSWFNDKRIDKAIGLDWTWERGNKRGLRTQAAQAALQASQAELQEQRVQQMLAAQSAFFDLLAAQERAQHIQALSLSAAQSAATATRRFAAGDLSAQDLARTEIEAQRANGDAQQARLEVLRAQTNLAQILEFDRTQAMMLRATKPSDTTAALGSLKTLSADEWVAQRPDVQAALARQQAAQAAVQSANALKSSDITLGTSLDHYPGVSTRLLQLRLQMPLQLGALGGHRFQGEMAKAQALQQQALLQLDRSKHAAALEYTRLQAELNTSQNRLQTYVTEIAPRAERVLQQAELAYGKGALSLTDLIEARRTWRNTKLEAIAAQSDADKAATAWRLRSSASH
jgi:outer membrane protein, heavy metal efflux system